MTRYATNEQMYQCDTCSVEFTMRHVRKWTIWKLTEYEQTNYYCPGCGVNLACSSHPDIDSLAI